MTSKRRKRSVFLFGALAIGSLVLLLAREREPAYEGKSLTEWVEIHADEFDHMPPDPNKLTASKKAIRQIGTNALPYLLKWVSYESPKSGIKKTVTELLAKVPAGFAPRALNKWAGNDFNKSRADDSTVAFFLFRDESQLCIPPLVKLMNDTNSPSASRNATLALGWIGPDAMPVLAAAIADTNTPTRVRLNIAIAAGMFPELGGYSASSVAVLAQCVEDPDLRVRETAIRALGRIGVQSRAYSSIAVPALTNCLRSDLPITTQYFAIRSLNVYSNDARIAVPLLLDLIDSPNPGLRMGVTNALRFIAPEVLTNATVKQPRNEARVVSTRSSFACNQCIRLVHAFVLFHRCELGQLALPIRPSLTGLICFRDAEPSTGSAGLLSVVPPGLVGSTVASLN